MILQALMARVGWALGDLLMFAVILTAFALLLIVVFGLIYANAWIKINCFGYEWHHTRHFKPGGNVLVSPRDRRHSKYQGDAR